MRSLQFRLSSLVVVLVLAGGIPIGLIAQAKPDWLIPIWAILGALAGGVGAVAVGIWLRPLQRLRAGVEQLAGGNLETRVPPTGFDEVGHLTRAFNSLGESLLEKERVERAFGRFASDYVVNRVLEDESLAPGAEREVTILFADIRSFTLLSEGMMAPDVVALLNEVFQLASDCILDRGGTLDKFMGDAVMAWFGAPAPLANHARPAVEAARALQRALAERNAALGKDEPEVRMGVGIHTGPVVVGTIGSRQRSDFTAIGDSVNVAQRLGDLADPGEILVSEAVWRRVREDVALSFAGARSLSGRRAQVHVYRAQEGVPAVASPEANS